MHKLLHKPSPSLSRSSKHKNGRPAATTTAHEHSSPAEMGTPSEAQVDHAHDDDPLTAQLGVGRRLDARTRTPFERAYGTSFAHVRLHTGVATDSVASRLNARAFTYGNHIAIAREEYRPGSFAGDILLAHELAHVQQQQGATSPAMGSHNMGLEHDADRAAAGAVLSDFGLESARPQLKTGLRLSRCDKATGVSPDRVPLDDEEKAKLEAGIDSVTEFTPDLKTLFWNQMSGASAPFKADLENFDLALTMPNRTSFELDPNYFEDSAPKKDGAMHMSELLRGIIALHELLHLTHDNASPGKAEGQGYGLELAFLLNFKKETQTWEQLSPEQKKSIDERIHFIIYDASSLFKTLNGNVDEANSLAYTDNMQRTSILFLLLLHRVREFDLHPRASNILDEENEFLARITKTDAQKAMNVLVEEGFDFASLEDSLLEKLPEPTRPLLERIATMSHGDITKVRTALEEVQGPKAKEETGNEAKTAEEDDKPHHDAFKKHQPDWGEYTDFMDEITKLQSAEFYQYFRGSEGSNSKPKLVIKSLNSRRALERADKKNTQGQLLVFRCKKNGDIVFDSSHLAYLQNHSNQEAAVTEGRTYLQYALEKFTKANKAQTKPQQKDLTAAEVGWHFIQ